MSIINRSSGSCAANKNVRPPLRQSRGAEFDDCAWQHGCDGMILKIGHFDEVGGVTRVEK